MFEVSPASEEVPRKMRDTASETLALPLEESGFSSSSSFKIQKSNIPLTSSTSMFDVE